MKTITLGYSDVSGKSSPKLLAGTEAANHREILTAAKAGKFPKDIVRVETWDDENGCARRIAICTKTVSANAAAEAKAKAIAEEKRIAKARAEEAARAKEIAEAKEKSAAEAKAKQPKTKSEK